MDDLLQGRRRLDLPTGERLLAALHREIAPFILNEEACNHADLHKELAGIRLASAMVMMRMMGVLMMGLLLTAGCLGEIEPGEDEILEPGEEEGLLDELGDDENLDDEAGEGGSPDGVSSQTFATETVGPGNTECYWYSGTLWCKDRYSGKWCTDSYWNGSHEHCP